MRKAIFLAMLLILVSGCENRSVKNHLAKDCKQAFRISKSACNCMVKKLEDKYGMKALKDMWEFKGNNLSTEERTGIASDMIYFARGCMK